MYVAQEVWEKRHPDDDMPVNHKPVSEPAGERFPQDDPAWFQQHFPRLTKRIKRDEEATVPFDLPTLTHILVRFNADSAVNDQLFKAFCSVTEREWWPERENGELVIRATVYGDVLNQLEEALSEVRRQFPEARDRITITYNP